MKRHSQIFVQHSPRCATRPLIRSIQSIATAVCRRVGFADPLGVILVGKSVMARLNYERLGRLGPTDVLSFSYQTPKLGRFFSGSDSAVAGELILCPAVVRARARVSGETFPIALRRTLIHGILHLIGYTHSAPRARVAMKHLEDRLVKQVGS